MRSDIYEQMLGLCKADEAETLAAVHRGLADFDAGRTMSLEEAMKELRSRHGETAQGKSRRGLLQALQQARITQRKPYSSATRL